MSKTANRDILFSLASQGVPAIAALASIPILVRSYGVERFGLLTFFWLILNYIGFLDLGITRTLTKTISSTDHQLSSDRLAVIKSAFLFLTVTGCLGFLLLFGLKDFIIERYLKLSPNLIVEAKQSLIVLSLTLPALLLFSFFKSVLEGLKIFSRANILQLSSGLISYLAPLICLIVSARLDLALLAVLLARWALVLWGGAEVLAYMKQDWLTAKVHRSHLITLFREGFWFSLLTVLNPLLIYIDRFLVTSTVPMKELAYYTAPFEVVTRFWLVPMAVTRILFPLFSTHGGEWTRETRRFFRLGIIWIAILTAPPSMILMIWGRQILGLWLGPSFGEQSVVILRILIVGIFFNSLNWVPFTMIQTSRHIKWTVFIPLLELALFLALFFPLVRSFGIRGAAGAWSARLVLDAAVWFSLSIFLRHRRQRLI